MSVRPCIKLKQFQFLVFFGSTNEIKLDLSPDANFIIGKNGTGKTTFINLINACLSADSSILNDVKFSKVHFTFKREKSRVVPQLTIEKTIDENGGKEITFFFKESFSAPSEKLLLSSDRRQRIITAEGLKRVTGVRTNYAEIRNKLNSLFNRTWLSLQRGSETFKRDDFDPSEIEYTSGVDRKLNEVINLLARYFSRLDRQVSELTLSFQRNWFLSFLATDRNPSNVIGRDLDIEEEKKAIEQIFSRFQVPRESYLSQLERHVGLAEKAFGSFLQEKKIAFRDFITMYDVMKLHSLVEQWQDLQEQQASIYKPKADLVDICSSMLFKKILSVNSSNTIEIKSIGGDSISTQKLSSGEKQLLIFLSETLLQEHTSNIFLADEPELSLHIEWQLQLVPSLLRINPSAQVIFATHSPDIVGNFRDNVFDMEDLVA